MILTVPSFTYSSTPTVETTTLNDVIFETSLKVSGQQEPSTTPTLKLFTTLETILTGINPTPSGSGLTAPWQDWGESVTTPVMVLSGSGIATLTMFPPGVTELGSSNSGRHGSQGNGIWIAGVVIGGTVGLVLIPILLAWFCTKQMAKSRAANAGNRKGSQTGSDFDSQTWREGEHEDDMATIARTFQSTSTKENSQKAVSQDGGMDIPLKRLSAPQDKQEEVMIDEESEAYAVERPEKAMVKPADFV
jgi:hypothetical protein